MMIQWRHLLKIHFTSSQKKYVLQVPQVEEKNTWFSIAVLTPFFCTFFGRKHGALHKYFIYTTGWITWTLPLWKLIGNFQNLKPNFNQNHAKKSQPKHGTKQKKGGVHCAGSFLSTWGFSRFSKRKLLLFRRGFFEKTPAPHWKLQSVVPRGIGGWWLDWGKMS